MFFWFSLAYFVVCFCCVQFSFFSTMPRDWLGRTSPKWPILGQVVCKTRDVKFGFLNIRSSLTTIRILFEIRKWPRLPGDDAQWPQPLLHHLITQQLVHAKPRGNHQWESAHLPTTTDASSKRPTTDWLKRPRPLPNDYITLCGILWCGRRVRSAGVKRRCGWGGQA